MKTLFQVLLLACLILGNFMATLAQSDQDDIEQAACFHIEVTLDATGLYLYGFLYQDVFNDLNADIEPYLNVQFGEPGTVIVYNVIVPRQTSLIITTTYDGLIIQHLETGEFNNILPNGKDITMRRGDMATECLGGATDGRINLFDQQMLAAIYPDGNGGYDIWAIDPASSEGSFNYNVTHAQVDTALAVADSSGQPQVIGSGTTSTLYALGDGECQLNSPNARNEMQEFIFLCS